MAKFDRPPAGFTPTFSTANINKYQNDSANSIKISSLKVDGDINFAIDAANEIWLLTGGGAGQTTIADTLIDFESRIAVNEAAIINLTAGSIPDGDKGDIVVSASATVWTSVSSRCPRRAAA